MLLKVSDALDKLSHNRVRLRLFRNRFSNFESVLDRDRELASFDPPELTLIFILLAFLLITIDLQVVSALLLDIFETFLVILLFQLIALSL